MPTTGPVTAFFSALASSKSLFLSAIFSSRVAWCSFQQARSGQTTKKKYPLAQQTAHVPCNGVMRGRRDAQTLHLFAHNVEAATPMTPAILELAFVHPPPRLIMLPFT